MSNPEDSPEKRIEDLENYIFCSSRHPNIKDRKFSKPLHTREKESLMKLIIGMAIDGYGYDPEARKSPIPKELSDTLSSWGIDISDDTIRKWLKLAFQHVSITMPDPET